MLSYLRRSFFELSESRIMRGHLLLRHLRFSELRASPILPERHFALSLDLCRPTSRGLPKSVFWKDLAALGTA
jgi:hypothetical protein